LPFFGEEIVFPHKAIEENFGTRKIAINPAGNIFYTKILQRNYA